MRIVNITSNTNAYVIIRDLNLKPKAAGTIDVDVLIVSELKSLRNLYLANDIIISENDFNYIVEKIASLSDGTASYPSFTGNADKVLTVTSTEDDVEWATVSGGGSLMAVNAQTGTTYTLALTDSGNCVEMNNAAANTLTIPPNSTIAYDVGTTILIRQMGAGQTTLVAGSGVTVRNPHGTLKLSKQYASVALHKRATDEWCIEGNLAES